MFVSYVYAYLQFFVFTDDLQFHDCARYWPISNPRFVLINTFINSSMAISVGSMSAQRTVRYAKAVPTKIAGEARN